MGVLEQIARKWDERQVRKRKEGKEERVKVRLARRHALFKRAFREVSGDETRAWLTDVLRAVLHRHSGRHG